MEYTVVIVRISQTSRSSLFSGTAKKGHNTVYKLI